MEIETLFSSRGLTVRYDDGTAALQGVDLDIARGEIVGIVGANGAGKSTLMSVLSGEVRPASGSMTIAGEIYAPDSVAEGRAAGVGYVPQVITMDGIGTVAEAMFRTSFRAKLPHERALEEARELIEEYGVALRPEDDVASLVPAEQASVELLRMVSEDTQVILLDEVSGGFDDHEIAIFHALARKLAASGRSVIHVSHRLDEVKSLSDRIVVIEEGRLKAELIPHTTPHHAVFETMFGVPLPERSRPESTGGGATLLQLEDVWSEEDLQDVTLGVVAGEVLGVTGMRRSGISELSELLAGERPVTRGRMILDGEEVELHGAEDALAHGVAYVPERDSQRGLDEEDSVRGTLVGDLGEQRLSFADEADQLREVIATIQRLGIHTPSIEKRLGALSGGDMQKVGIARTLAKAAKVFVLNQPTRGIDARAREEIYAMINELTQAGCGVVLVSSDMTELMDRCHRIAILRDHRLVDVYANSVLSEDLIMLLALGHDWYADESAARRGADHAIDGAEGAGAE